VAAATVALCRPRAASKGLRLPAAVILPLAALVPYAEEQEKWPGDSTGYPRFPYTVWRRPPYRRVIFIRKTVPGTSSG